MKVKPISVFAQTKNPNHAFEVPCYTGSAQALAALNGRYLPKQVLQ